MVASQDTRLVRRLVEQLGGRYSLELGIDVDRGEAEIERWALAATLFGNRISAAIAVRTYRALVHAGVRTIADAGARSWEELVALLDAGGYARYDGRTADRLRDLAATLRCDGGAARLGKRFARPEELEAALDALPGWGLVTVRLFLRELRGVWPGAELPLDGSAVAAAEHLRLAGAPDLAWLARAAGDAELDRRDLETALVRLAHRHRRGYAGCAGGLACLALEPLPAEPSLRRFRRPRRARRSDPSAPR